MRRITKGCRTPDNAGTIEDGVETAGRKLFECAVQARFGANSRVHVARDGAPWIAGQVEQQFGEQGSSLELDLQLRLEPQSEARNPESELHSIRPKPDKPEPRRYNALG
jgi:hypothetical protein